MLQSLVCRERGQLALRALAQRCSDTSVLRLTSARVQAGGMGAERCLA